MKTKYKNNKKILLIILIILITLTIITLTMKAFYMIITIINKYIQIQKKTQMEKYVKNLNNKRKYL